jgi:hypothetical protein
VLCLERAKQAVEFRRSRGVAALLEHADDFVALVAVLPDGNIYPLVGYTLAFGWPGHPHYQPPPAASANFLHRTLRTRKSYGVPLKTR